MKKITIDPTLMDEDKYEEDQISESAETLMKAEEIKKDKKLMEKIAAYLQHEQRKISNLQDLKDLANNFKHKIEPMADFEDHSEKE